MKTKTIEKILRGQFANFIKSIKDDKVRKLVIDNSIITGGSIVSLILEEKVNDYDIYFTNKETVLAVANYYRDILIKDNPMLRSDCTIEEDKDGRIRFFIRSTGLITKQTKAKFYPSAITDNAISLTNDIQLILRFYGPPEEIHKNYDFVHVKSYWLSKTGKLYLNPESLEAILAKELRYTGSLYPLASIFRLRKFLSRGWTISAGDIFKMAFQLRSYDLSDPQVLYDQLIGVDVHYFNMMIERIKSDIKSGKVSNISESYVSELVDEIFHQTDDYDLSRYLEADTKDEND